MGGWENIWLSARKLSFFPDRLSAHGHTSADSVSRGSIASITGGVVRWTVLLSNLVTISLGFVYIKLLEAKTDQNSKRSVLDLSLGTPRL